MDVSDSLYTSNKNSLKLSMFHINNTYEENIYNINFLNCPTPSRLMGKDSELIRKWRLHMDYKQKNGILKNDDLYRFILA
jgi:hypothetical protein